MSLLNTEYRSHRMQYQTKASCSFSRKKKQSQTLSTLRSENPFSCDVLVAFRQVCAFQDKLLNSKPVPRGRFDRIFSFGDIKARIPLHYGRSCVSRRERQWYMTLHVSVLFLIKPLTIVHIRKLMNLLINFLLNFSAFLVDCFVNFI